MKLLIVDSRTAVATLVHSLSTGPLKQHKSMDILPDYTATATLHTVNGGVVVLEYVDSDILPVVEL